MTTRSAAAVSAWVWVVVGAWYAQVVAFLLVGSAADVLPSVSGLIGVEVVGSGIHRPWGVFFVALGLLSAVLSVLVVLGHGFAMRGLVLIGTMGTVGLALLGSWVTFVVPSVMLLAVLLVLATPALDHLEPATDDTSAFRGTGAENHAGGGR